MGQLSRDRLERFDKSAHLYFDWVTVLNEGGVTDIQDLDGQYLLKCPFHDDDIPSFRVKVHDHYYHCFSCGRFGSVAKLMWELSGKQMKQSQFYDLLLKRTPQMQKYLGFTSLFIDAYTLDSGFEGKRKFSAASHIGAGTPIKVLAERVRLLGDSWENLVYSLTMLQSGESPEMILHSLGGSRGKQERTGEGKLERVSLSDLVSLEDAEVGDA